MGLRDGLELPAADEGWRVLDGIAAGLNDLAREVVLQRDRELEQRERGSQAQHHAAMGRLAAGVAHEINNPAAGVLANLAALDDNLASLESLSTALRASFPGDSEAQRRVVDLLDTARLDGLLREAREITRENRAGLGRIVGIVRDLKDYATTERALPAPVTLDSAVTEACRLGLHEVTRHARLVTQLVPTPAVMARRARLVAMVSHLLAHAAALVAGAAPGQARVVVRTLGEKGRARVRVEVIGAGSMRPSASPGEELLLAARIAEAHGGGLQVDSLAGGGASFEVWLPAEASPRGHRRRLRRRPRRPQP